MSARLEEALNIIRDIATEDGAELADVESAFHLLREALKDGPGKRLRRLPLPEELSKEAAIEWCEKTGGHTTTGFLNLTRCERCPGEWWD